MYSEFNLLNNPSNSSAEEIRQLQTFFAKQPAPGIWIRNQPYTVGDNIFRLGHTVIGRCRKEGKTGFRYEIIDCVHLIAKGANGTKICPVIGTLALEKQKISQDKARVVKIQSLRGPNSLKFLESEYEISKLMKYLAIKKPVIDKSISLCSYTILKRLPGEELLSILDDNRQKKNTLTSSQRLKIINCLLEALKSIKDLGVIHRDLKPENVMGYLKDETVTLYIIDFGLSLFANKTDNNEFGTAGYIAPEIIARQNADYKSDVFSLGIVIYLILGGKVKHKIRQDFISNGSYFDYEELFMDIDDLQEDKKRKLFSLIKAMVNPSLEERISVERALFLFRAIYFDDNGLASDMLKIYIKLYLYRDQLYKHTGDLKKIRYSKPSIILEFETEIRNLLTEMNNFEPVAVDSYGFLMERYENFLHHYHEFAYQYNKKYPFLLEATQQCQSWLHELANLQTKITEEYHKLVTTIYKKESSTNYQESCSRFKALNPRSVFSQNRNGLFQRNASQPSPTTCSLSPEFTGASLI